jgi:hypothetical protein
MGAARPCSNRSTSEPLAAVLRAAPGPLVLVAALVLVVALAGVTEVAEVSACGVPARVRNLIMSVAARLRSASA